MTFAGAALWVTGITFFFLSLGTFAVSVRESAGHDIVAQLLCQVAAYSVGLFLLLRYYAPETSIRRFLALRPTHPALYVLAPLLGVALVMPANLFFELSHQLFPQLDRSSDVGQLFFDAGRGQRVAIAVAVIVVGPIVEEVLFRGALHALLLRSYRPLFVVAGTSVLFALVHLDPHAMFPILIVGAGFGLLRAQSGSLWPPLLMHAAFNAVPIITLATSSEAPSSAEPAAPPWIATGLAVVACAGLLWATTQAARLPAARIARSRDSG